jgi:hypothetical protein
VLKNLRPTKWPEEGLLASRSHPNTKCSWSARARLKEEPSAFVDRGRRARAAGRRRAGGIDPDEVNYSEVYEF